LILLSAAAGVGVYMEATRPRAPNEVTQPSAAVSQASEQGPAPAAAATRERVQSGILRITRAVHAGASDASLPWALAHGLEAFGKDHRADDGRLAVDVIASFVERVEDGRLVRYRFPARRGGVLVEPHRDLLLEALLDQGVPLDRSLVAANGERLTLARLAADLDVSPPALEDDAGWHQAAWTLHSLALLHERNAPPGDKLPLWIEPALDRLERDHALADGQIDSRRAFEPGAALRAAKEKKSHIYGHSCGGLHLVQAVFAAVARAGNGEQRSRVRKQLGVLLYRYEAERAAYAALLAEHPEHGLSIRVQQLKFFGHLLETLGLARELALYDPKSEGGARIERVMRQAATDVLDTFDALEGGGVYHRLSELRREREQTYLDLIGDGCHAIRGLERASSLLGNATDAG
jgi:hypothetical protein